MIVDLNPTDEQRQIVDSVESLLAAKLPVERLRKEESFGCAAERVIWRDLAELGLFGFGLSESAGGIGYGLPEEVLVARSLGRHCISSTVIATMLAVHVAETGGNAGLSRSLASGETRAAFANPLDGREVHLIDSADCDWLLTLDSPFKLLPREAARIEEPVGCIDEAVELRRARIDERDALGADLAARGSLLLASHLVGNAQATLAMATAYAGVREQFGQPIGAFQAIKHGCADMAVRAAGAEAQSFYAAVTWNRTEASSAVEIACARWLAREAAITNAKANIQIHGAMGFTAECDAHLYLKRALLFAHLGTNRSSEEQIILGY
jgi:alkylation response protein AidB-like acyl-CoA dehydrogenase